ncbi:MAG: bifunctional histidinol-phosphatase/imidazoleglycerol-phosphate dehydratase HisB [Chitinophagaceae bacterium]
MKKSVLFIDRDGTLICEPEDFQIDSLEKLRYYPGVFRYLSRIAAELDYELVMVSNQDGLGTPSFPEEQFWPAQDKMLEALEGEGIRFKEIYIDRSFPEQQLPTRKPGTAMLTRYISGDYDLSRSYVIGDRITDLELAQNLGAGGILIGGVKAPDAVLCTSEWADIYSFLRAAKRRVSLKRTTRETDISVRISLDGTGNGDIQTGIGFFDHMLQQLAFHSGVDLYLRAEGDLHVDEHHLIEDTGIVLGQAYLQALGNAAGIGRYGFVLPMDDCECSVSVDMGGRPWLVWNASFNREMIGAMPTEMFPHFFKSFSDAARCTLHINANGTNEHHKIEGIFKAFARALAQAIRLDGNTGQLPSTKGLL